MRTGSIAAGALALALSIAAFPAAAIDVNRSSYAGDAIEGYDAVAFWELGEAVPGSRAFTLEWEGATWRFTSAAHRDLFAGNPERYAPRFGGYCAYGMTRGVKTDINPFFFVIEGDGLFLFFSAEARDSWLAGGAVAQRAGADQWAVLGGSYF